MAPLHRIELLAGSPEVQGARPGPERPAAVYDATGRWLVEAVVLGDGEVDRNGFVLRSGVTHASAQGFSPMEAFHPIHWDAKLFAGAREGAVTLSAYPMPGSMAALRNRTWPQCVVPARRRKESRTPREEDVARYVLHFLRQHPGLAVRVSGIGARGGVNWAVSSLREVPGQPRCTAAKYGCVKAAVINAVYAFRGTSAANVVEEVIGDDTGVYYNFRPLGRVFQRARETIIGCRVAREENIQMAIQSADRWAAFRALAGRTTGVFIVRLQEVRRVDHAVVVDAGARVIIDSEEATAIELSAKNLSRCGGDEACQLRVIEVRQVTTR